MTINKPMMLCDIATLLSPSLAQEDIFNSLFSVLNQSVPFSSATLYIYSSSDEGLLHIFQHGKDKVELANDFHFENGNGITSWISTQSSPIVFRTLKDSKWNHRSTFQSMVSIPLHIDDKLIGVLNLGHGEPHTYKPEFKDDYYYLGQQFAIILNQLSTKWELVPQLSNGVIRRRKKLNGSANQESDSIRISEMIDENIQRPIAILLELVDLLSISLNTGNLDRIKLGIDGIRTELNHMYKLAGQITTTQTTISKKATLSKTIY